MSWIIILGKYYNQNIFSKKNKNLGSCKCFGKRFDLKLLLKESNLLFVVQSLILWSTWWRWWNVDNFFEHINIVVHNLFFFAWSLVQSAYVERISELKLLAVFHLTAFNRAIKETWTFHRLPKNFTSSSFTLCSWRSVSNHFVINLGRHLCLFFKQN